MGSQVRVFIISLLCLALPWGLGCSTNNTSADAETGGEGGVEEAANTIAGHNPNIDFQNLVVGNSYILTPPDPSSDGQAVLGLQAAILKDVCTCLWILSDNSQATFEEKDTCITIKNCMTEVRS